MTSSNDWRVPERLASLTGGLLLVLLLALVVAQPAEAGYKKFQVGVMDGYVDPATDVPAMGRVRASTARLLFNWSQIEVRRGDPGRCNAVYDWSYTDALVSEAGRRGVRLLPVLIGSPGYIGKGTHSPATGSDAIGDWKCFVRAVGERYGRGGNYLFFDADARPIREWQIWNEPSIPNFATDGKVNPREYGRFVKVSRRQLVAADPKAGIVLAGIPERYRGGMNARPFLKKLFRVKRIKRAFDVVAVHSYAKNHRGIKGAMVRIRRHLRKLGTGGRPVWLTEAGWSTGGPDLSHPIVKSEKVQAKQLSKLFRMLRSNRKRFGLGTVNWFRWRDAAEPGRGQSHFDFAGLYEKNGRPKPSCNRFQRFTGGRRCQRIHSPPTASSASSQGSERVLTGGPEVERRTLPSRPVR